MNLRQHTTLAKRLIKTVGGAKMAEHVSRLGSTQLYQAMDDTSPYCLPADVIVALEREAGTPIYTTAMAKAAPDVTGCDDLTGATLDVGARATELAVCVHQALADGRLSNNERSDIAARLQPLLETIGSIQVEITRDPVTDSSLRLIDGEGRS